LVRKNIGAVLAFVGGFLVVLAILVQVFAAGQLKKTPLDVNSTTNLSGTAELSDGTKLVSAPVTASSVTKSDTAKSDGRYIVMVNSSCLIKAAGAEQLCVSAQDPQKRLLSASTDTFMTDRVTAMSVNNPDYLPADAVKHEGLVNKWPFDAENKTYPYWDSTLGKAVDAAYDRTATIDGVTAKIYKVDVQDQPAEISDGIMGTYSDTKEIWIEPTTGSIINQTEHRELVDSGGNPFLTLDLAFTDAQVKASSQDAASSADQLTLLTKTAPLVGYLVGLPLLLIGLALMFFGIKREDEPTGAVPVESHPAHV
jgi:hypothetical protein